MTQQPLRARYTALEQDRNIWLQRAHKSALLTIPSVQLLDGMTAENLPQTFSSLGARGVNNLGARLSMTLFPTEQPFVRLTISQSDMEALLGLDAEQGAEGGLVSEIEENLLRIEEEVASAADHGGWRPVIAEMFRLLIVSGNALLYDGPRGPMLVDMRRYVVRRSPEGVVEEVVLRQAISKTNAEQVLGAELTEEQLASSSDATISMQGGPERHVDLYTGAVLRPDGKYDYWQEIAGVVVEGTERSFKQGDCPLIPLRWAPVYGEHWGRGFVEDLEGDLLALHAISRALTEAAVVMSKVVWTTRPGSATKPKALAGAQNGAIITGDPDDVSCISANKGNDLAQAQLMKADLIASLSKAMLLNSGIQRQAERVTAAEIRAVSMELEDTLGGVYASLATNVQRPITEYLLNKLQREGKVTKLPKEVRPAVVGGLDAITRNHRAVRIQQFLAAAQQSLPPESIMQHLRVDNVLNDLATSLSLSSVQYLKTPEEIQAEMQAAQEQQAFQTLAPEAMKQMGAQPPPPA